jgi:hypothetical protein
MEMIRVESSNITAIGHSDEGLVVEFKGGNRYRYAGVPADTFAAFQASESKGKFFAAEIKARPDAYPVEKLPKPSDVPAVENTHLQ